jgi:gliding motility-associated lipoprotein GldH
MRNTIALIITSLLIFSCNQKAIFDIYKPISNSNWNKDSIVEFNFHSLDSVSKNNIFINLRNNDDYQYSNLFLIVNITFPNNYNVIDTLEYEMTDVSGKFLGSGFTDLKENRLEYKTNVIFPDLGEYKITVQQAMRKSGAINGIENLKGVTDVGLLIEKIVDNE